MKFAATCVSLFICAGSSIAGELPPAAVALQSRTSSKLLPAVQRWVETEARRVNRMQMAPGALETTLRSSIDARFAGQALTEGDIDTLLFLLMMEAAKSSQEDLRAIMEGVKTINKEKESLRGVIDDLNKEIAQRGGSQPCTSPNCSGIQARMFELKATSRSRRTSSRPPADQKATLDAMVAGMKSDLDSMSEMGEMESLRLQMAMDRLSKMMSTLSNLLKKISDTAQAITQNIK